MELSLKERFLVCGFQEIRSAHYLSRKNCQDGLQLRLTDESIAGVVCDGSTGHRYAEVGAILAAKIALDALSESTNDTLALNVNNALKSNLRELAGKFPDAFVFNLIAFHISLEKTQIIRLGDGVAVRNGEELARGTCGRYFSFQSGSSNIFDQWEMETDRLQNLMIGSDGANEFDLRSEQKQADGHTLGGLPGLLDLDEYEIRQKLQSAQQIVTTDGERRTGIFQDDVSLIIVKRNPE